MDELSLHPTAKPVEVIADAIRDVSGRGDILLNLFDGSRSTMNEARKPAETPGWWSWARSIVMVADDAGRQLRMFLTAGQSSN